MSRLLPSNAHDLQKKFQLRIVLYFSSSVKSFVYRKHVHTRSMQPHVATVAANTILCICALVQTYSTGKCCYFQTFTTCHCIKCESCNDFLILLFGSRTIVFTRGQQFLYLNLHIWYMMQSLTDDCGFVTLHKSYFIGGRDECWIA